VEVLRQGDGVKHSEPTKTKRTTIQLALESVVSIVVMGVGIILILTGDKLRERRERRRKR